MSQQSSPEELLKQIPASKEPESKKEQAPLVSMEDQRQDLGLSGPPQSLAESDQLGSEYLDARRAKRPGTLNDANDGTVKENCGLLAVGAVTNQTGGQIAQAHGFDPSAQPATAWYGRDDTEHDHMGGVRPSVLVERFETMHGNQMKWIAKQMVAGQTLGTNEFESLVTAYNKLKVEYMLGQPSINGVIQQLMAEYIRKTLGQENVTIEPAIEPGSTLPVEEGLERMGEYPTGTQFVVFLETSDGGCAHYVYAEHAKDVIRFVDFQPKRSKEDTFRYTSPKDHPTSEGAPTKVPFPMEGRPDAFSKMNFLAVIPTTAYIKSVVGGS